MFQALFTRENITLALSLFGALGTAGTWIYNYFKARKNFSLEIIKYLSTEMGLLLFVQFTNKSSLPISISEIAVDTSSGQFICEKYPLRVFETTRRSGKEIISHEEKFSIDFPINLPAFCGTSGYLYFSSETETFPPVSTQVTLIIRTNRGREVRKTLELTNPFD